MNANEHYARQHNRWYSSNVVMILGGVVKAHTTQNHYKLAQFQLQGAS
jgi:hypothetical protein